MKTRHLTLITLLCMALLAGIALIPYTASAENTSAEDTAKAGTYQITFDQAFPDVSLASSVSVRVVGTDGKAIGQDHVFTRAEGEAFKSVEFTESFTSRPYRLFYTLVYTEPGAAESTTYTFHPRFRTGTQEIQTYYDTVITLGTCSIKLLEAAAYGVEYDTDVKMDGQSVGKISVSAGGEPLTAESTVEPETEVEVSFSSSHYSLKTVKVTGESGADIPCGEVAGSPDHFTFAMPYEPVTISVNPSAIGSLKIPYTDAEGKTQYCEQYVDTTEISDFSMEDGTWYVAQPSDDVEANTFDSRLQVKGNVNLILCDGVRMNANQGISVPKGSSLTIWGQSQDENTMGRLKVVAPEVVGEKNEDAGIGGDGGSQGSGAITINGGSIDATGSMHGAAIGSGGDNQSCEPITINGGVITATTAPPTWIIKGYGAAIGSGNNNKAGAASIYINGGTIEAKGASGAGIGSGSDSVGANVTITGGRITAKGLSEFGAIIADTLNITGGSVKAIGKLAYDATGSGVTCNEGKLSCDGMFVYAGSGEWDSYRHKITADKREEAIKNNPYVIFYRCDEHEMEIQARENYHCEICKWCNGIGDTADHDYAYRYSIQDHWQQCTVCGHEKEHAAHEFDPATGACVCGLTSAAKYTVTFDSDGGPEIDPQYVEQYGRVIAPEVPAKSGYAFLAWRKVDGDTIADEDYDFNAPVVSDLTLKAVWKHNIHDYTTLTKIPGTPATCESPGAEDCWECSVCGALFTDEFGKNEVSNPVQIDPLGHDYQPTSWEWKADGSDDYESATVTFTCRREGCSHTDSVTTEQIYKSVQPATCTSTGRIIYTAIAEPDFLPYTCSNTKVKVTSESKEHAWQTPVYNWMDGHESVLAKRVCALDPSHVETEYADTAGGDDHAKVTPVVKTAPTCTKAGLTEYTVNFRNPAFGTQVAQVKAPALGHSFGPWEPISDTEHQRICERDPSHVETAAHTWAQLEILRPVSTSHTGERLLKCTTCQKVIHDIIPKLKKNNTLSVKGKTVKLKAKKLKKKKKTISRKKALKVTGAQGKLTYTKVKVNKKKYSKKFTVNSKNGKITVKKGVKKGLYKVTVKVRAAGNSSYKPVTRTVTVKVRVK